MLLEMEAVVRRADEIRKQAQAAAKGFENELSIAIDDHYPATVFFRSNVCGMHQIFVVAGKGTAFQTTKMSNPLTVDCR